MQQLNTGYSVRTNKRYGRTGHLVRNRFYSGLVEDDVHLLEAIRYIVLNPVRAGLCQSPAAWPWSSYRACAGTELAHPFLSVDRVLGLFGTRPESARDEFCAFVREGHVPESDTGLEGSRPYDLTVPFPDET